jgi:hypothetical protein
MKLKDSAINGISTKSFQLIHYSKNIPKPSYRKSRMKFSKRQWRAYLNKKLKKDEEIKEEEEGTKEVKTDAEEEGGESGFLQKNYIAIILTSLN